MVYRGGERFKNCTDGRRRSQVRRRPRVRRGVEGQQVQRSRLVPPGVEGLGREGEFACLLLEIWSVVGIARLCMSRNLSLLVSHMHTLKSKMWQGLISRTALSL
jgi:hypothetical protein